MSSQADFPVNGHPSEHVNEPELIQAVTTTEELTLLRAAADAHSAQEFSDLLDVPVQTCTRLIEKLTRMGLLKQQDSESATARDSEPVFCRDIRSLTLEFDEEELNVTVENRTSVKRKLDDVWQNHGTDGDTRR